MDKKKKSCDIATTPPIKKPTAIELWNLRMIIVPPMLSANSMKADHMDMKPSASDRVPMTANDINARMPVIVKIEYLQQNENRNMRNNGIPKRVMARHSHPC